MYEDCLGSICGYLLHELFIIYFVCFFFLFRTGMIMREVESRTGRLTADVDDEGARC